MAVLRSAAVWVPRYGLLLGFVLLELMLAPFFASSGTATQVGHAFAVAGLVAAVLVVGIGRVGLALFAGAVALQAVALLLGRLSSGPVVPASRLPLLCYVLGLIVWRVLRDRDVTWDTVAGSACGYVLLGAVWGDLYQLIHSWRPTAFEIPSSFLLGPAQDAKPALLYFSYVTLTTVGYGVIHPTDPGIGGLCMAEAICGQLYLAIMISRMVGLHIAAHGD